MRAAVRWILLLLCSTAWADVAVVGTPNGDTDDGDSYAPESGSNRVVVWGVGTRDGADTLGVLVSATYDGDAMTAETAIQSNASGVAFFSAAIFRQSESDLPAGSAVLDFTSDNPITLNEGAALTLSGVNQSSPVADSSVINGSGSTSFAFPGVDATDGDMAVMAAVCNSDITGQSGYSTVLNNTGANPRVLVAYKSITSTGTENATITLGSSGQCYGSLVIYGQAPAGAHYYHLRH